MQELLTRADDVRTRKVTRESMTEPQPRPPLETVSAPGTDDEPADLTDLTVVRSFRYPGGRLWTASVTGPAAGSAPALRFTAGARIIDLKSWPRDWADLPDDQLVDLLRHAIDRPIMSFRPETPRRRYDDPPK